MLYLEDENKNILKFIIIILCLLVGIYFVRIFQTPAKTVKIYKEALKDYQNGNYSNAYYLFSRISVLSGIKPFAIYRQAQCARALGDSRSELKAYQKFLHRYPASKMATEVKYEAAQLLADSNPVLAQRYFNSVIKSVDIDENYKIASEYYIAKIKASNNRFFNKGGDKSAEIESAFRNYLEKAPDGRLASAAANTWLKYNPGLSSKDSALVAKAYYVSNMNDKAKELIKNKKEKDTWIIQAAILFNENDYSAAKSLVETGVGKYADYTNYDDLKKIINLYLEHFGNSYEASSKLLPISKGKAREYVWNLKCENSPTSFVESCYNELYSNYPNGEYASKALSNMFSTKIAQQQYIAARQLGNDYLRKFPKSDYTPMVMFWMGKIAQKYSSTSESVRYFQDIINKFPDSYYAYRAFWILKGVKSDVVKADLENKSVIYPYKFPTKGSAIYTLIKVNDYDLISRFTNDEFIKSWTEYQKGNYSVSVHMAQKAMDLMEEKPLKSDIRWRLVYPLNYYIQVQNDASKYGNNIALIMAILREESYFNMYAQSEAGAMGLMQLMPSTAHEVGSENGIDFNTTGLFNPELNIKLGNLYYASLRKLLNNQDGVSIAAYNGGSGSVTNWQNSLKYSDIDEFVEQIPYAETKNYVKKVFKSYWNYVRIYQK